MILVSDFIKLSSKCFKPASQTPQFAPTPPPNPPITAVALICLPDGRCVVALRPPGLWWVEVSTPQLPVEALGGQRVLLDLEGVVLDVVKGGRHHARAVLLDTLQDRLCPVGKQNQRGVC